VFRNHLISGERVADWLTASPNQQVCRREPVDRERAATLVIKSIDVGRIRFDRPNHRFHEEPYP
jgi:hypothetical protein